MAISTQTDKAFLIGWKTWFLWVLVCALQPLLFSVASTAFNKTVLPTHPHITAIYSGLGVLAVVALLLPIFLTWSVLRRVAPALKLWAWCFALLAGVFVVSGLHLAGMQLWRTLQPSEIAATFVRTISADAASLLWMRLIFSILAVSAAMALVPATVLGRTSPVRWYVFVIAACVGSVSALLAYRHYEMYFFRMSHPYLDSMGGLALFNELVFLAGVGAVWGASSCTVVALLGQKHNPKIKVALPILREKAAKPAGMLLATLGIVISTPLLLYSMGSQGIRAGFPQISKALTTAPDKDQSIGESVLQKSHEADFASWPYPVPEFAPDGNSFVALSADRKIQRINAESGANLGQIGESLDQYENYAIKWSSDGRYMVLRTNGKQMQSLDGKQSKHLNRFRLFDTQGYQAVAQYTYPDGECFQASGTAFEFEPDGKSLWVRCEQFYSPHKPTDVFAVQLEIPSMKMLQARKYGARGSDGGVQGLGRVGTNAIYWQKGPKLANQILIRSLSSDQDILALNNLDQKNLAGNLTFQNIRFTDKDIELDYCGNASDVADPGSIEFVDQPVHSFCRALGFDSQSGELKTKRDHAPTHRSDSAEISNPLNTLKIKGIWSNTNKTGEIFVQDLMTGKQRQHIISAAQRPLGFSPDGNWLITHVPHLGKLRFYRVSNESPPFAQPRLMP